jgi:hypothetical protein
MNTHLTGPLTADDLVAFHRDGYLIKRSWFSTAEVGRLLAFARGDSDMLDASMPITDANGRNSRLTLWNHPGDDLYGMFSRCPRVVTASAQLMGEEVYHWHSKMMLKEPKVGGAWEWHQDYGYWYLNGCLFPNMLSCMVAVDRANKENGCLQVLRGSHHLGRIDHGRQGTQVGADPERMTAALKRFELVHFEAEPGDAVFFHGNTLHASGPNLSEHSRWSLVMAYNARSNSPFCETSQPFYTPIDLVSDEAIMAWTPERARNGKRSFLRMEDDVSLKAVGAV